MKYQTLDIEEIKKTHNGITAAGNLDGGDAPYTIEALQEKGGVEVVAIVSDTLKQKLNTKETKNFIKNTELQYDKDKVNPNDSATFALELQRASRHI
jgi:hypothetical protein